MTYRKSSDQAALAPLVLGLGCERGTPSEEVIRLAQSALAAAGGGDRPLACIASLDARMTEPALIATAAHFSVPLQGYDAATLERETTRLKNPSDIVFALTGCHGVAEAAALAAAGTTGALLVPKMKSAHATAAVASIDFCMPNQRVTAISLQCDSPSSAFDSAGLRPTIPAGAMS